MAQANISVLLDGLRGKAGSVVFVNTKDGVVVRPRVTPANPRTAAQTEARSALGRSATMFKNMDPTVAAQWNIYAGTQSSRNVETGRTRSLSGMTAFTQLSSKFLQVSPTGTVPTTPPTAGFAGDGITFTVTNSGGQLTFTASGPNAAGITTELLLQRLPSQNRTPTHKGYRAKAFHAFASGSLTAEVPTTPGWYVPAVRFVNTATGQASLLTPLAPIQAY